MVRIKGDRSRLGSSLRMKRRYVMNRIALLLVTGITLVSLVAAVAPSSQEAHKQDKSALGEELPAGYRDWRLISVAREEGELDDIRAILGNDAAIKAYREGKHPFPEGTIVVRIAWSYDS